MLNINIMHLKSRTDNLKAVNLKLKNNILSNVKMLFNLKEGWSGNENT